MYLDLLTGRRRAEFEDGKAGVSYKGGLETINGRRASAQGTGDLAKEGWPSDD